MGSAFNTIQAANNGITSITKLVQSAQALVSQAQQTSDTTVRASLATQFDQILTPDRPRSPATSGFNGINLLDSNNSADLTRDAERNRLFERHHRGGGLQRHRRLAINNATNNWGGTRRHRRGQRRADRPR